MLYLPQKVPRKTESKVKLILNRISYSRPYIISTAWFRFLVNIIVQNCGVLTFEAVCQYIKIKYIDSNLLSCSVETFLLLCIYNCFLNFTDICIEISPVSCLPTAIVLLMVMSIYKFTIPAKGSPARTTHMFAAF